MPYIITTKRPGAHVRATDGVRTIYVESRRAVATLEEAREIVSQIVADSHPNVPHGLGALAEPGMVGPLPDGTVIEVRRVLIENVIADGGLRAQYITAARHADTAMSDAEIIDAYNAKQ